MTTAWLCKRRTRCLLLSPTVTLLPRYRLPSEICVFQMAEKANHVPCAASVTNLCHHAAC